MAGTVVVLGGNAQEDPAERATTNLQKTARLGGAASGSSGAGEGAGASLRPQGQRVRATGHTRGPPERPLRGRWIATRSGAAEVQAPQVRAEGPFASHVLPRFRRSSGRVREVIAQALSAWTCQQRLRPPPRGILGDAAAVSLLGGDAQAPKGGK